MTRDPHIAGKTIRGGRRREGWPSIPRTIRGKCTQKCGGGRICIKLKEREEENEKSQAPLGRQGGRKGESGEKKKKKKGGGDKGG